MSNARNLGELLESDGEVPSSKIDSVSATKLVFDGHILPSANDTYDIGSAEYKIRDMYVSDNSLWIGDQHKITIAGGKGKFRKRKAGSVPSGVSSAGGNGAGALAHSGKGSLGLMSTHEWLAYRRTFDSDAKIEDVFGEDDFDAEDGLEDMSGTLDDIAEGVTYKKYSNVEKTKLAGIATNANLYVHPNHSGDVVSTADGATVIQVDAVDIPMLSATGTASSTTFLRGDNAWATVNTNLVADTSPQLGGDLDLNSNNITGTGGIPAANLTGTIAAARLDTATTQAESNDSTKIATTAYVTDKITTLIGGAPSTLNDLNELAAAINDDSNYNSTLTTALATKLPLAGGTMTGILNITTSGTGMTFNTPSTGQNSWITWKDGGTSKWEINKNTANNFNIYSYAYGSDVITLKETGKVGIGTTNPTRKLHIESTTAWGATLEVNQKSDGSDGAQLFLKKESASPAAGDYLGFLHYKGMNSAAQEVQYARIHATSADVTDGSEDGSLFLMTAQAGTENSNGIAIVGGNVGIGTATPNEGGFQSGSSVLSIQGAAADDFGVIELISPDTTGSNRIGEVRFGNLDGGGSFASNAGIRVTRDGADNSSAISLWNSSAGTFANRLHINSSGSVGIGTASPLTKLNIVETAGGAAGIDLPITISSDRYQADYGVGIGFRPENNSGGYKTKAAIIASGGGYGYGQADLHFCIDSDTTVGNEVSLSDAVMTLKKGGKVGIGTTTPTGLLHVQGAEPVVKLINTTNSTTVSTSKRIIYNSASGSQGMITDLLFSWQQVTADSWIMVRTPQAYADGAAGGWADMKLSWTGYHASNNTLKMWTAVFHNNHSRIFSWNHSGITTVGGGSGSYGPYNYTPAVAFYKQTSSAHGYTTNDAWMRNLFIKVSGNSASNVCSQRSLYINGLSGGMEYEVFHMGTTTPGGGLTAV